MKKLAILFVLAILTPCGVLAWLATRAMREEESIIEQQRVSLAQEKTASTAARLSDFMAGQLRTLERHVDDLLAEMPVAEVESQFDAKIQQRWADAEVGFAARVVGTTLTCPVKSNEPRVSQFYQNAGAFFTSAGATTAWCWSFDDEVTSHAADFTTLGKVVNATAASEPKSAPGHETTIAEHPVATTEWEARKNLPTIDDLSDGISAQRAAAPPSTRAPGALRFATGNTYVEPDRLDLSTDDYWSLDQVRLALDPEAAENRYFIRGYPETQSAEVMPPAPTANGAALKNSEPTDTPALGPSADTAPVPLAGKLDSDGDNLNTREKSAARALNSPVPPNVSLPKALPDPPIANTRLQEQAQVAGSKPTDYKSRTAGPEGAAKAAQPELADPASTPESSSDDKATRGRQEERLSNGGSAAAATPPKPDSARPSSASAPMPAPSAQPALSAQDLASSGFTPSPKEPSDNDLPKKHSPALPPEADAVSFTGGVKGMAVPKAKADQAKLPAQAVPATSSTQADKLDERKLLKRSMPPLVASDPAMDGASEDAGVRRDPTADGGLGSSQMRAKDSTADRLPNQSRPAEPLNLKRPESFATRSVEPQHLSSAQQRLARRVSLVPAEPVQLASVWSRDRAGLISRFASDGSLIILAWHRPSAAPDLVFGVQLGLKSLQGRLAALLRADAADGEEFCLALLDHTGQPVARSLNGYETAWHRPSVSTEIGATLPRWEAAAYLLDPWAASTAAKSSRLRLGLLVLAVLAAALTGAILMWREARRRLLEARQKSDFVSNVSHELRTPLTSIRMFSDLLAQPGAVATPEKTQRYAEVISQEAGRLTRLINNVLDFSRLERGQTQLHLERLDLAASTHEIIEQYRPHVESLGFSLKCDLPETPLLVRGDQDRLSQVILNLLGNAEKYGAGQLKEIEVRLSADTTSEIASLSVSDRGPGVPRGKEKRVFEQFYRADDALATGVQGTGLGLTLARQIARAHRGDVTCQRRDGGGASFILTLPLASVQPESPSAAPHA